MKAAPPPPKERWPPGRPFAGRTPPPDRNEPGREALGGPLSGIPGCRTFPLVPIGFSECCPNARDPKANTATSVQRITIPSYLIIDAKGIRTDTASGKPPLRL